MRAFRIVVAFLLFFTALAQLYPQYKVCAAESWRYRVTADGAPGLSMGAGYTGAFEWDYSDNGDGTVTVRKYTGAEREVTVPGTVGGKAVTALGMDCFAHNGDITGAVIPYGVIKLEQGVFFDCPRLRVIVVPPSVTEISPYYVFDSNGSVFVCADKKSAAYAYIQKKNDAGAGIGLSAAPPVYKDGLTIVETTVVGYAGSAAELSVPKGITAIGAGVFRNMTFLRSAGLPDTLTVIGERAFEHCINLESITLPGKLAKIGGYAFCDCWSLEDIEIPASVTSVGDGAFRGCTFLKISTLPATVKDKGADVFKEACDPHAQRVLEYNRGVERTAPGDEASLDYYRRNVCPPDGAQTARDLSRALIKDCKTDYEKLRAICGWVSATIKYDSDPAYLAKQQFNPDVDDIIASRRGVCQDYAFCTMALLREAGIPCAYLGGEVPAGGIWKAEDIKAWQAGIYANRHAWNAAYIDGRWTYLDNTWNSTGNTSDYFDASLLVMSRAHRIENIEYYGYWIENGELYQYTADSWQLDIPRHATRIRSGAFRGSEALLSVKIPTSFDSLGNYTFADCKNLSRVSIPSTISSIGDCTFWGCKSLAAVDLPNSIKSVGYAAFYGCESMGGVRLDGIQSIGDFAFNKCGGLLSVRLGSGIKRIGYAAFGDCGSLSKIYIDAAVAPAVDETAFCNVKPGAQVIVPHGAVGYGAQGALWHGLIVSFAPVSLLS